MRHAATLCVDVAVVGGGVVGCSTARALSQRGATVALLEQNQLTSGTTWHAAGLLGTLKGSAMLQDLAVYGHNTYKAMTDEATGQSLVGFVNTGSLGIARCSDSMERLTRQMQLAKHLGYASRHRVVTPTEIKEIHPFIDVDSGVVGGVFSPDDGICNPSDVTLMLATEARRNGVVVKERTECTKVKLDDTGRRILELHTDSGDTIVAGNVVFCGGAWTKKLCALAFGENRVPVAMMPHQYIIFEKGEGIGNHLPVVRDVRHKYYLKPEVGGFMLGIFEGEIMEHLPDVVRARNSNAIPMAREAEHEVYPESIDKAGPWLDFALDDVPSLGGLGIKEWLHGPDTHSCDHSPLIGLIPGADNSYVATGFNSQGIQCGPGVGVGIAETILDGAPHSIQVEFSSADPSRFFQGLCNDADWVEQRAAESYGEMYGVNFPNEGFETARGRRKSSFHEQFAQRGAVFGEVFGWERPLYLPAPGERASASKSKSNNHLEISRKEELSFQEANRESFPAERRECIATRSSAALFDLSAFGKLHVSGPNSLDALQMCFTAEMDKPIGTVTYTVFCNSRGGTLGDATVARLGPQEFYVVTLAVQPEKVMDQLLRVGSSLGFRGKQLVVDDVSDKTQVLAVNGPRARDVLSSLTTAPLGISEFPKSTAQQITIAGAQVLALRVSFAGEFGWEIHCPSDTASVVFEAISGAGAVHGAVPAGVLALLNSLRMEKAFIHYGSDVTMADTPLEAGLAFACKLKPDEPDFIGKAALVAQKQKGWEKRLVSVRCLKTPNVSLFGHEEELLYRNGELIGALTSGGFSHTLDCPIGMGYVRGPAKVPLDWLKAGSYEVEVPVRDDEDNVKLQRIPAEVSARCLVDPKGKRILGQCDGPA